MVNSNQNKEEGAVGGLPDGPSVKPKRKITPTSKAVQDPIQKAKSEQKNVRTQITVTISSIHDLIDKRDSRGRIRAFLGELKRLMDEAVKLHAFLSKVAGIEPAKLEKQQKDHLKYVTATALLEERAEEHLDSRADEATTVATQPRPVKKGPVKEKKGRASEAPPPAVNNVASKAIVPTKSVSMKSAQSNFPSQPNEQEATANGEEDDDDTGEEEEMGEEEELVNDDNVDDDDFDDDDVDDALLDQLNQRANKDVDLTAALPTKSSLVRVADWLCDQEEPAPDDWIDKYVEGSAPVATIRRSKDSSSLRARLETFSGQSLDWFLWISQFHSLVHLTNKSPDEKLAIMQSFLTGDARLRVAGLAGGEAAYKQALSRLKQAFGKRGVMRCALKTALNELKIPANDPVGFQRYADRARTYLFDLSRVGETGSNDIIDSIVHQLVLEDRRAWNTERRTLIKPGVHSLNIFGEWLCDRAAAYQTDESIAAAQRAAVKSHQQHRQQQQSNAAPRPPGFRNARTHQTSTQSERAPPRSVHFAPTGSSRAPPSTTSSSAPPVKKLFCFQCNEQHKLTECSLFKARPLVERVMFATEHRLCRCCFGIRHRVKDCRFKKECGVGGCKEIHHQLLHGITTLTDPPEITARSNNASIDTSVSDVALGSLRVDVFDYKDEMVEANVLADECSDTTMFREGFLRRLGIGIYGPRGSLAVDTVGGERSRHQSQRAYLKLRTPDGEEIVLHGLTIPIVAKPVPVIDWSVMKSKWNYLEDLPLKVSGGRVDILLGADYAHLLAPTDVRIGSEIGPVGSKTRLGWIVRGVLGVDKPITHARINAAFSSTENYSELVEQMRRFCDTDAFGSEHKADGLGDQDREIIQLAKSSTKKLETGYQVDIVWKKGEPKPPNNLLMAESRNRGLIARFKKEPSYEKKCREAMEKNFTEGYARRLSQEEANNGGPAYYLPVFGTTKKWNDKIRIVFDAAARFQGRCLNDCVESGPALQNPLPIVITRFRWSEFAWAADIQAMFSRIRLKAEDRPFHRFLWPEEDGKVSVCEMLRLTFGVSCSPFLAILVTWIAAEAAGPEMKEAAAQIKRNLYIDDYLSSAPTEKEAIQIAAAVKKVLAAGDFHLTGWTSNSLAVTEALQPTTEKKLKQLESRPIGPEAIEMVLGMSWNPSTDTLGFRPAALDALSTTIFTRIGLVSCVARVYDPLGLAAPITVKAKIRNRQIALKGLNWHDPVDEEEKSWWEKWLQSVQQLRSFEIPRCLFAREHDIDRVELHTFGDASEEAIAAVSYTRSVYKDGSIIVRLVKANTVLSKMKTVSIPKLELDAAVLAVRQSRFIEEGMGGRISARFFWTDSSTVRNWIRSTASNYQVYVSNRIGEVQSLSKPEEWRFIPGKLNPADAATRSKLEEEAVPKVWQNGAALLYTNQEEWPVDLPWLAVTAEIRAARVHHVAVESTFDWAKVPVNPKILPSLVNLDGEYLELIKRCQEEAFPSELDRLERGKAVRADSKLFQLNPRLDEKKIIRLGGRLEKSSLPYDQKHPPILPGKHPFTRSIIKAFHIKLLHVGTDFLVTQIRQHFWLVNGREAVKKVKRECVQCRQQRAQPVGQLMGDLHSSRLAEGEPPFSRTAVDYFGPMEATFGRNRTKKVWGVLFTCLTTRAVYLDLSPSLSSTDFLLILRRFIGIYGQPKRIHSDNGTNFVGAERVLREAVLELHQEKDLKQFMEEKRIEWTFQPARTPHFGGAHESLVRSTKRALYSALDQERERSHSVTEDVLRTLLFEVAGLLNSRPLTCAGTDPDDLRPLTPNDFLNKPPAADLPTLETVDISPQDRFRQLKRITALFWSHWRGSYLQSLAVRPKWNQVRHNLQINDIVMERDVGISKGRWSIGRVCKTYPGEDGLVRAVDVELENGVFNRGVQQLCLLQSSSADDSSI